MRGHREIIIPWDTRLYLAAIYAGENPRTVNRCRYRRLPLSRNTSTGKEKSGKSGIPHTRGLQNVPLRSRSTAPYQSREYTAEYTDGRPPKHTEHVNVRVTINQDQKNRKSCARGAGKWNSTSRWRLKSSPPSCNKASIDQRERRCNYSRW